jgi:DNA-binding PadR family transcriptional regulator
VVLGLIEQLQPATPYDLKQAVAMGVSEFWSLPHTQLYSESKRLAEEGYLSERREDAGRRRRLYRLNRKGQEALDRWRSEPTPDTYEIRDAGLLKLFFGADAAKLANPQLEGHKGKLREYEEQLRICEEEGAPEGMRLAVEAGIGHEREYIRFWAKLLER